MPINGSTLISQSTLFLRDIIASGITDPIASSRSGSERFIMTSYPERPVRYPIITVRSQNFNTIQRGGMQSEEDYVNLPFEIRVWAKDQRQKDQLAEQVYTWLRLNQFSGTYSTVDQQLFGFKLNSMVDVDEEGKGNPKSKVMEIEYKFVAI